MQKKFLMALLTRYSYIFLTIINYLAAVGWICQQRTTLANCLYKNLFAVGSIYL